MTTTNTTLQEKEILRPEDLATLIGCSKWNVYRMMRLGRLPFTKQGRATYIPRSAWEAWLEQLDAEAMTSLSKR